MIPNRREGWRSSAASSDGGLRERWWRPSDTTVSGRTSYSSSPRARSPDERAKRRAPPICSSGTIRPSGLRDPDCLPSLAPLARPRRFPRTSVGGIESRRARESASEVFSGAASHRGPHLEVNARRSVRYPGGRLITSQILARPPPRPAARRWIPRVSFASRVCSTRPPPARSARRCSRRSGGTRGGGRRGWARRRRGGAVAPRARRRPRRSSPRTSAPRGDAAC